MTQFTTNLRLELPNFNLSGWHDAVNQNFRTIDVVIAASTGITGVVGAWDNDTVYTVGNKVVDSQNDTAYRCLVAHTSAASGTFEADRTANPTYWVIVEVGVSVRGAWLTATTYYVGDIVYDESENIVAMCETEHVSGALRTDALAGKWTFIADLKSAVDAAETAAEAAIEAAQNASEIADGDIGPIIAASSPKTLLVANDRFAITNSENSHALEHTTYGNLITQLSVEFDLDYAPLVHTHSQSDITNLVTDLGLLAPKANPTFTGTVTLAGDPSGALEASTKQYVDAAILGLGNRTAVRVATTANITIATALNNADTIDGISLVTGDYVLVKDQTTATQNGIYVVGPSPARAPEFDTWNELVGVLTAVQEGSVNADTLWLNTSNKGGTLGSTNVTYQQMVVAGELKASNNLSDLANAATAFGNIKQAASDTATGVVELLTDAEAQAGTDTTRAMTAANLQAVTATTTRKGVAELATDAEVQTGTDTNRVPSVASMRNGFQNYVAIVTTTSGTSFDTAIPSWANEIVINLFSVSLSGTDNLLVRLGDSGGVENTGYTGCSLLNGTASNPGTTGFNIVNGNAGDQLTGTIVLRKVDLGGTTWMCTAVVGSQNARMSVTTGVKVLDSVLTTVRLLASGSNTFDVGGFNVSWT